MYSISKGKFVFEACINEQRAYLYVTSMFYSFFEFGNYGTFGVEACIGNDEQSACLCV